MAFSFLRTAKLKTAGNIGGLNAHLQRTKDTPNADPELTHLNEIMRGSTDLLADVNARLEELASPLRKNAVMAVEHLMTFSPDFVQFSKEGGDYFPRSTMDPEPAWLMPASEIVEDRLANFKERAIAWLDKRYGAENVVNVQLHLDEKTPHIHAVVVPVDERGKLNCRAFLGGREKMRDMQDSFGEEMASLGLVRGVKGSKAKHQDVQRFYTLANELTPGLAAETVQARLQASDKDRQKDLNPPLVATVYYHDANGTNNGAHIREDLDSLEGVRVLAQDPAAMTIKFTYSTESQDIEQIHGLLGMLKKADCHVEESGADFVQRRDRVFELERSREREGPQLGYD